jgi:hypothetical protein
MCFDNFSGDMSECRDRQMQICLSSKWCTTQLLERMAALFTYKHSIPETFKIKQIEEAKPQGQHLEYFDDIARCDRDHR